MSKARTDGWGCESTSDWSIEIIGKPNIIVSCAWVEAYSVTSYVGFEPKQIYQEKPFDAETDDEQIESQCTPY